jgi:gas vesicle protein
MFPFGLVVGFAAGAVAAALFTQQLGKQARPAAKVALKTALRAMHEAQVRGAEAVEAAEDLYAEVKAEVSKEAAKTAAQNETVGDGEPGASSGHEAKARKARSASSQNKPAKSKSRRPAGHWADDVKKYVPDADLDAIAGIVRHCGIALQSRNASLVAFSDRSELNRVRDKFLRRKLGLTLTDEELDDAIAVVGERMKGASAKNRVTVYYLLADHFGKLSLFTSSDKA